MKSAAQIIELATKTGLQIATAESCTGGLVSAALTEIPGSSAVLERGFVTYSNAAKIEMLGVKPETLDAHGAVSEEVAAEMARGAILNSAAQLSVSITGIAGPGGSDFKPEGRVCFATFDGETCDHQTIEFGALGRANVRCAARDHALALLHRCLLRI